MAVLALPALLAAATPAGLAATSATVAAATLAGGLIDQLLLMPALFPGPEIEPGRLGDLQLQTTAEGAPRNRVYGKAIRVPCHLVWQTKIRELPGEGAGSGKGGRGGEFLPFRYRFDFAVELCRGPISRVVEVWADGKRFWAAEPDISYSSNKIAASTDGTELVLTSDMSAGGPDLSKLVTDKQATIGGFTGGAPPFTDGLTSSTFPNNLKGNSVLRLTSAAGGTLNVDDVLLVEGHVSAYRVSTGIVVSAATQTDVAVEPNLQGVLADALAITILRGNSANNGAWKVVSATIDEALDTSKLVVTHPQVNFSNYPWAVVAEGVDTVTVFQTQPTFRETMASDMRFQLGHDDQDADELMVEFEQNAVGGPANVYAGIGRARMIVEDFDGADFGNRLPNLEALVEVTPEDGTLASVIKAVCLDHGLSENQVDASGVTGTIGGYNARGPQSGKNDLAPLLLAGHVVAREVGGVLTFSDRLTAPVVTVDAADLSAHEPGQDVPGLLDVEDRPDHTLPTEILVSFVDAANEYQTSTRRSALNAPLGRSVKKIDLPIVLTQDQGQQLADAFLAIVHGTRRTLTARLGPSQIGTVTEGSILNLTNVYGDTWKMLVASLDRGANSVLVAKGREEDDALYTQTSTSEGAFDE